MGLHLWFDTLRSPRHIPQLGPEFRFDIPFDDRKKIVLVSQSTSQTGVF
jgi:hypothetical protein